MANKQLNAAEVFFIPESFTIDSDGNLSFEYERDVNINGLTQNQELVLLGSDVNDIPSDVDYFVEEIEFTITLGERNEKITTYTDKIYYTIKDTSTGGTGTGGGTGGESEEINRVT